MAIGHHRFSVSYVLTSTLEDCEIPNWDGSVIADNLEGAIASSSLATFLSTRKGSFPDGFTEFLRAHPAFDR